jgi:hypothetical protein
LNTGGSTIKATTKRIQRLSGPSARMNESENSKMLSRTMSRNESRKHWPSKPREQQQVLFPFCHPYAPMMAHIRQLFSDTYTVDQLIQSSIWCLTDFSGPRHTFIGIRDRAMLLLSSTLAFRGDSARNVLWSDLFSTDIPMDDISLSAHVKVC